MKLRVQAQHLKPGDVVGSGEEVVNVVLNSIGHPSNKVYVKLVKFKNSDAEYFRSVLWGKYTMIGIDRAEEKV